MARTVFANTRNMSHQGSGDKSLSTAPDVCKTPIGNSTPPIPYPVMSQAGDLGGGSSSVKIDGNPTALADSNHASCTGDEPGTAKGVGSGVTSDITEFATYSFDVKVEGKGVVRHMDMSTMNKSNTIGMVLGSMTSPTIIRDVEPEAWDIEGDESLPCFELVLDFGKIKGEIVGYTLKLTSSGYSEELDFKTCQRGCLFYFCFRDVLEGQSYSLTVKIKEEEVLFENKNIDHFLEGVTDTDQYVEPIDIIHIQLQIVEPKESFDVRERGMLFTEEERLEGPRDLGEVVL